MKNIVNINGKIHGYFYIKNGDNLPTILYLHGGPGSPEYPIFQSKIQSTYLKNFNIVYYDHIGCGLSYTKLNDYKINYLVEDVKSISEFIILRYKVEKLILVGHSFGSFIGIQAAKKFSNLYYFYLGISQVVDVKKSECIIYDELVKVCIENNDFKNLSALNIQKKQDDFPSAKYLSTIKEKITSKYHIGLTRKSLPKSFIIKRLITFKDYSFIEKIQYMKGLINSSKVLFPQLIRHTSLISSYDFSIPIHFIHGKYDFQVAKEPVVELLEKIYAPTKSISIFEHSAHFPNIEEIIKFDSLINKLSNEHIYSKARMQ